MSPAGEEPTTENTIGMDEGEIQKYRWPPFPDPPEKKVIIPFSEFQPKGIVVQDSDEEDEYDGDGVKTVKLLSSHIADPKEKAAHDRAKRARKRRKGPQGPGLGPKNGNDEEFAVSLGVV